MRRDCALYSEPRQAETLDGAQERWSQYAPLLPINYSLKTLLWAIFLLYPAPFQYSLIW